MSKQDWTPTEADFDQWDDEKEAEAIRLIGENTKVRHVIKNDEYWALVPGGRVYKLPLQLSIAEFEAMSASSDTENIERIKQFIRTFAGETQAESIEREPMQVVFNLLQDYARTLVRTQGVDDMGKSSDSAMSSNPTMA